LANDKKVNKTIKFGLEHNFHRSDDQGQSMTTQSIKIKTRAIRRIPEFAHHLGERYIAIVAVEDLPLNLPTTPNPRDPNINRLIWKQVKKELMNEGDASPNTFHLKNKGITIVAGKCTKKTNQKQEILEVVFDSKQDHGIVDGGHTYHLLKQQQQPIVDHNIACLSDKTIEPITQYVKLEILAGYDNTFIPEIARGLNTGIQVKEQSLSDLLGNYDAIKEALKTTNVAKKVSYNENGTNPINITDLIKYSYILNTAMFNDTTADPSRAYASLKLVLNHWNSHLAIYNSLAEHIYTIGYLADYISYAARDAWNSQGRGKRGGNLSIISQAKRKSFKFHFLNKSTKYRLENAVLLPCLSAFRAFLSYDEATNKFTWTRDLDSLCKIWDVYGAQMMATAHDPNMGATMNAKGKNPQLWKMLYLQMRDIDRTEGK